MSFSFKHMKVSNIRLFMIFISYFSLHLTQSRHWKSIRSYSHSGKLTWTWVWAEVIVFMSVCFTWTDTSATSTLKHLNSKTVEIWSQVKLFFYLWFWNCVKLKANESVLRTTWGTFHSLVICTKIACRYTHNDCYHLSLFQSPPKYTNFWELDSNIR